MNQPKHTPGPWRVDPDGIEWRAGGYARRMWLRSSTDRIGDAKADQLLVQAAPDLLAALRETLMALQAHIEQERKTHRRPASELCPCETNEVARARLAIAKATGTEEQ